MLGKLAAGEVAVGEVVTGEIVLGKLCWGNDPTPSISSRLSCLNVGGFYFIFFTIDNRKKLD